MNTAITLAFADGDYDFDLGLAQISEIQDKVGLGIGAIYARLLKGRFFAEEKAIGNPLQGEYHIEDIVSTIRQGLIGGGKGIVDGKQVEVNAHRAGQLVERYVLAPGNPLKDAWALAAAILMARIEGYTPPEETKPQPAEGKKKAGRGRRAGSTTPEPSPTAQ